MIHRTFIIAGCVSICALGSAVALAQTKAPSAESVATPPLVPQDGGEAVDTPAPSDTEAAPDSVEDAPIDVPLNPRSDWAPDINYDAQDQEAAPSGLSLPKAPPQKVLSDAGENVLGTGSWSQSVNSAKVQAQLLSRAGRRERPIDPLKRSDLTKLSRVMGALHALRVSCSGRDDQTYRSRMATLLDLEAPDSGALRDPLVDAFNGGFQAFGRGAGDCPSDARMQEARLAKDGFALSRIMSARYRPTAKVASILPPANQARQNGPSAGKAAVADPSNVPPAQPSWNKTRSN